MTYGKISSSCDPLTNSPSDRLQIDGLKSCTISFPVGGIESCGFPPLKMNRGGVFSSPSQKSIFFSENFKKISPPPQARMIFFSSLIMLMARGIIFFFFFLKTSYPFLGNLTVHPLARSALGSKLYLD